MSGGADTRQRVVYYGLSLVLCHFVTRIHPDLLEVWPLVRYDESKTKTYIFSLRKFIWKYRWQKVGHL